MKRVALASVLLASSLLLTGCLNLRGNLEVGRDAKLSGKLTGEINKQLASMAGITSKDALVAQMTDNTELFPAGTSVTETDDAYVMERTFRNVTMQDPEGFSVTRSGEEIVFQLTFAQQEAATEDDLGLGNLELGRVNLTMEFPGDIIQVSGNGVTKTDARTVKIDAPITTATTRWTVRSGIAAPTTNYLPFVVGAVVLLGIAVLLVILKTRSRRAEELPAIEYSTSSHSGE